MADQQYINCPDCGSKIPFDPYALIRGAHFKCPQCPDLTISLDPGSKKIVEKTLDEFDAIKGKKNPDHDNPSS